MITVALFWTASNQKESKSLLPKGWINDLYTHAIECYAVVRLNKPQVQTTVDETHKHDIDWERLDRNEHTEAQARVKEAEQIQASDSGVRDKVQFRVGGWGQVMQGSMRGLQERLSFHFWIWMPATWVFLNIHGVVHCWQVHNFVCFLLEWKVKTYHLDTAAFNAVPGSLW